MFNRAPPSRQASGKPFGMGQGGGGSEGLASVLSVDLPQYVFYHVQYTFYTNRGFIIHTTEYNPKWNLLSIKLNIPLHTSSLYTCTHDSSIGVILVTNCSENKQILNISTGLVKLYIPHMHYRLVSKVDKIPYISFTLISLNIFSIVLQFISFFKPF